MTDLISGLPYPTELLSRFYEEGGKADLSKVKFPKCKTTYENMKSAITYLRNTSGFGTKLVFYGMDYEQKVALLKAYLDTDVAFNIPELNVTWLQILYACAQIKYDSELSIINELELQTMIAGEREYLLKLAEFIASLPLFLVTRLDCDMDMSKIEKVEEHFETANLINVIKEPDFDTLLNYVSDDKHPPKFYEKNFTLENTELFEAMANTTISKILIGMLSETKDSYLEFLKAITFEPEVEECTTSE